MLMPSLDKLKFTSAIGKETHTHTHIFNLPKLSHPILFQRLSRFRGVLKRNLRVFVSKGTFGVLYVSLISCLLAAGVIAGAADGGGSAAGSEDGSCATPPQP